MRPHRMVGLALIVGVGLTAIAEAQRGGKPKTTDQPGTASFRCAGLDPDNPCGADGFVVPDSITGDSNAYVGIGDAISGSGAFLRADGEFALELRAGGGRQVYLNFNAQVAAPSGTFRRKTFTQATLDSFHLNTNVIDPASRQEAVGGLRKIPLGQTWQARIKAFWTDQYGVDYTIRFNPDHYPGSSYVWITREGDNRWTIEAGYNDYARLVSPPERTKGVSASLTDEGLYSMPFKLTVTVP